MQETAWKLQRTLYTIDESARMQLSVTQILWKKRYVHNILEFTRKGTWFSHKHAFIAQIFLQRHVLSQTQSLYMIQSVHRVQSPLGLGSFYGFRESIVAHCDGAAQTHSKRQRYKLPNEQSVEGHCHKSSALLIISDHPSCFRLFVHFIVVVVAILIFVWIVIAIGHGHQTTNSCKYQKSVIVFHFP